jgi:RNA-binding protein Luc7-like 2
MTDSIRQMLDEMMGADRNGSSGKNISFEHPSVCHDFVLGLCPHELFRNTKYFLGDCKKEHSLSLQEKYKQGEQPRDIAIWERDHMRMLETYVSECDRRVQRNIRARRDEVSGGLSSSSGGASSAESMKEKAKVAKLNEEIVQVIEKAQDLGQDGQVKSALNQMTLLEGLKSDKAAAERELKAALQAAQAVVSNQKLKVCDVCAAYLSLLETDERLADHFGGKLHVGYQALRTRLSEWRANPAIRERISMVSEEGSGSSRPYGSSQKGYDRYQDRDKGSSYRHSRDDRYYRSGYDSRRDRYVPYGEEPGTGPNRRYERDPRRSYGNRSSSSSSSRY